jgi:hypothetical protein
LDSQPSGSVTIGLTSTDLGEGIISSSEVVFAVGDWNAAQAVTVTGVDDVSVDGNIEFNITTGAASSSDTNFNGASVVDVRVSNLDGRFVFAT